MTTPEEIRQEQQEIVLKTLSSAVVKMRVGMLEGPEGKAVELTPAEATVILRVLTERLGFKI